MKKTTQKPNQKSKKKIWFKEKKFGWGWYPSTWQGWVVFFFYFVLVAVNYCRNQNYFIPETIVFTLVLILICWFKGEKPKWRWGSEKK